MKMYNPMTKVITVPASQSEFTNEYFDSTGTLVLKIVFINSGTTLYDDSVQAHLSTKADYLAKKLLSDQVESFPRPIVITADSRISYDAPDQYDKCWRAQFSESPSEVALCRVFNQPITTFDAARMYENPDVAVVCGWDSVVFSWAKALKANQHRMKGGANTPQFKIMQLETMMRAGMLDDSLTLGEQEIPTAAPRSTNQFDFISWKLDTDSREVIDKVMLLKPEQFGELINNLSNHTAANDWYNAVVSLAFVTRALNGRSHYYDNASSLGNILVELERVTEKEIASSRGMGYKFTVLVDYACSSLFNRPYLSKIVHHLLKVKGNESIDDVDLWLRTLVISGNYPDTGAFELGATNTEIESILYLMIDKMGVSKVAEFVDHVMEVGPLSIDDWYEIISEWNEDSAAYPVEWLVDIARSEPKVTEKPSSENDMVVDQIPF